jgi:hypothetical protein
MDALGVWPVTRGPAFHHFGYYDKFPWDRSGRYLLGLETRFMDRPPTASDAAVVGLIDTEAGHAWRPVSQTHAWNWQQGAMLQWLGSQPETTIVHNICAGDRFEAVVLEVETGAQRRLPRPVYALSADGRQAVSVNFARIAQTRPGYGYAGPPDPWAGEPQPAADGVYWMEVDTGRYHLIVSLARVVAMRHTASMDGCKHWFNHLQFNPSGTRFLFLHRWVDHHGRRQTRLFTAAPDGSGLACVADHDMVSHFDWRDDTHILAWARQHPIGDRYYVFTDPTGEAEVLADGVLTEDGHCSYSPDRRWLLTDTYPGKDGKRGIILYDLQHQRRLDLGRFYAMPDVVTGEIRCDLHPRWSRDGRQVCFDSVHEGTRQIYVMDVRAVVDP